MKGTWQTTGSGSDSIGPVLGVIGAVILAAAVAGPVLAAVGELVRAVLIAVAVVVVLAVIGGAAVVAHRLRHPQPRALPRRVYGSTSVQGRSQPRVLPARPEVHLHFHGVTAEDVAAIVADVNHEDR
jgi:hypothetical protein